MTGTAESGTDAPALRWRRMKGILADALELSVDQQQAYLRERAGDVDELVELQALWAAGQAPSDILDAGTSVLLQEAMASQFGMGWVGREIGGYRLLELIAHGGMGQVYRAERSDDPAGPHVAVKLMRDGLGTPQFESRFLAERQTLARLNHPHLARLLNGGVAGGVPYLVMELVRGQSIDVYCNSHALTVPRIVELFCALCDAVHYAHTQGVVHRDLKPANVLVTDEGQVKLVDFGIAKVLGEPSAQGTATTVRVMTLACASPEQVRGQKITPASDVYSLGVLVYQLLTGRSPYRLDERADDLDVRKAICEAPPLRPSLAASGDARCALKGHLDTVLLRALSKEPLQRQPSAQDLSLALKCHLESLHRQTGQHPHASGTPVLPRWRLIRARGAVAVGILLGAIVCGWYAWSEARAKAQLHQQRISVAQETLESSWRRTRAAHQVLVPVHELRAFVESTQAGAEALAALASHGDPELHAQIAMAHLRIAAVKGGPLGIHLDDKDGAVQSYSAAVSEIDRALSHGLSGDSLRRARWAWAKARIAWARLLARQGRSRDASGMAAQALVQAKAQAAALPRTESAGTRLELATAQLGLAYAMDLDEEGALIDEALESSLPLLAALHAERPSDETIAQALAENHVRRGDRLLRADMPAAARSQQAASAFSDAIGVLEGALQAHPDNAHLLLATALVQRHLGQAQWHANRQADALASSRQARDSLLLLWQAAPDWIYLKMAWAQSSLSFAELLLASGSSDAAVKAMLPVVDALEAPAFPRSDERSRHLLYAAANFALGKALMERAPALSHTVTGPIPSDWLLACDHWRRSLHGVQGMRPRWDADPHLPDAARLIETKQLLLTCPSA